MKANIIHALPSSKDQTTLRLLTIGEHEVQDSRLLFNGGPNDYRDKLFAIHVPCGNFSHCLGVLWSEGEHTALDDACDENLLDCLQVEESEATDDTARLGNASEPFDLTDVSLVEIPRSVWRADWEFVFACGRVAGGENIKTGADV